jgi:hypothetical protein
MGVTMIRVFVLAVSTAFVLAPAAANAMCGADHTAKTAQASSTDLAAKKKAAPVTTTDGKGDAAKAAPAK